MALKSWTIAAPTKSSVTTSINPALMAIDSSAPVAILSNGPDAELGQALSPASRLSAGQPSCLAGHTRKKCFLRNHCRAPSTTYNLAPANHTAAVNRRHASVESGELRLATHPPCGERAAKRTYTIGFRSFKKTMSTPHHADLIRHNQAQSPPAPSRPSIPRKSGSFFDRKPHITKRLQEIGFVRTKSFLRARTWAGIQHHNSSSRPAAHRSAWWSGESGSSRTSQPSKPSRDEDGTRQRRTLQGRPRFCTQCGR